MSELPGIRYTCAKCGKLVTDWDARVTKDLKLVLTARCHQATAEIHPLWLDIGGTLFKEAEPGVYRERAPPGVG